MSDDGQNDKGIDNNTIADNAITEMAGQSKAIIDIDEEELLSFGLRLLYGEESRQHRWKLSARVKRFKTHFGAEPITLTHMLEDFQTTIIEEARVKDSQLNLTYFLLTMNFLYRYDTDEELASRFKHCAKTVSTWKWFYIGKICALKEQKVSWLSTMC